MIRRPKNLLVVFSIVIAFSASAHAQNIGGLTSGNLSGGNLSGGNLGGGNLGGGNLGGGNLGGGNLGQNGSSGGGSSTTSSGASGAISGLDANRAFDQVQRGNEIGATGDTGKGFSASSMAPPGSGANSVTPGGIGGGRGGFGGVGGFGNLFNGQSSGGSESSKPTLRTRLRSAVGVPGRSPLQVGMTANDRLRTLPSRYQMGGVQVQMQGRTAVIQGSVANESDRRMSQLLMSLEPGVSRIDNRVIVQP